MNTISMSMPNLEIQDLSVLNVVVMKLVGTYFFMLISIILIECHYFFPFRELQMRGQ